MGIDYNALREALALAPQAGQKAPSGYEEDAVCLLLFDRAETMLLAIQKTDTEGYHCRDQVALPGGRIDPTDRDATDAALRELGEELSVDRSEVRVLGNLGHFPMVISRNDLEVIVGRWMLPSDLRVDHREIERVLELSLTHLVELHVREGFHARAVSAIGDALIYPLPDAQIWGVTARILHEFLELVINHKIFREGST
jgi:8-oxo-dGTP pyrophosphatase MutT (NUDIX family)